MLFILAGAMTETTPEPFIVAADCVTDCLPALAAVRGD